MLHDNLIFILSAPRSGSTLLQRMVGSHSEIYTHPEPHLLTPLYYLGYYETVERAPYDHINAALALREFCQELPHGENDYLDALRAYASTLYERVLAPTGKIYFLDKTPAYALLAPFIAKLYPRAKFIVLTRHPLAILHSVAHSFFGGDYSTANEANPIISRYVPALGEFLLSKQVPMIHIRYEDLVADPEHSMRQICAHIGVPFEPTCVRYGEQTHIRKSFGDPVAVERHREPVKDYATSWAADLQASPEARALAQKVVASLDERHLAAWGFPKEQLYAAFSNTPAKATHRRRLDAYQIKRSVLLHARKTIRGNMIEEALRKTRYFCDVLLRA